MLMKNGRMGLEHILPILPVTNEFIYLPVYTNSLTKNVMVTDIGMFSTYCENFRSNLNFPGVTIQVKLQNVKNILVLNFLR